MAKVILGKRPPFIKSVITGALPGGDVGRIEARYVYRTRTEYGEMIDKRLADARAEAEAEEARYQAAVRAAQEAGAEPPARAAITVAEMERRTCDANAAYLLDNLLGWDLDRELSMESLQQLCDEAPAMAQALVDGYRAAIIEGRLGN